MTRRPIKLSKQRQFLAAAYYAFTNEDVPESGKGLSPAKHNILLALRRVSERLGMDDLETLKNAFDGMDDFGNSLIEDAK